MGNSNSNNVTAAQLTCRDLSKIPAVTFSQLMEASIPFLNLKESCFLFIMVKTSASSKTLTTLPMSLTADGVVCLAESFFRPNSFSNVDTMECTTPIAFDTLTIACGCILAPRFLRTALNCLFKCSIWRSQPFQCICGTSSQPSETQFHWLDLHPDTRQPDLLELTHVS